MADFRRKNIRCPQLWKIRKGRKYKENKRDSGNDHREMLLFWMKKWQNKKMVFYKKVVIVV